MAPKKKTKRVTFDVDAFPPLITTPCSVRLENGAHKFAIAVSEDNTAVRVVDSSADEQELEEPEQWLPVKTLTYDNLIVPPNIITVAEKLSAETAEIEDAAREEAFLLTLVSQARPPVNDEKGDEEGDVVATEADGCKEAAPSARLAFTAEEIAAHKNFKYFIAFMHHEFDAQWVLGSMEQEEESSAFEDFLALPLTDMLSYLSAMSPGAKIDAEREGLEDLEDALQAEVKDSPAAEEKTGTEESTHLEEDPWEEEQLEQQEEQLEQQEEQLEQQEESGGKDKDANLTPTELVDMVADDLEANATEGRVATDKAHEIDPVIFNGDMHDEYTAISAANLDAAHAALGTANKVQTGNASVDAGKHPYPSPPLPLDPR